MPKVYDSYLSAFTRRHIGAELLQLSRSGCADSRMAAKNSRFFSILAEGGGSWDVGDLDQNRIVLLESLTR